MKASNGENNIEQRLRAFLVKHKFDTASPEIITAFLSGLNEKQIEELRKILRSPLILGKPAISQMSKILNDFASFDDVFELIPELKSNMYKDLVRYLCENIEIKDLKATLENVSSTLEGYDPINHIDGLTVIISDHTNEPLFVLGLVLWCIRKGLNDGVSKVNKQKTKVSTVATRGKISELSNMIEHLKDNADTAIKLYLRIMRKENKTTANNLLRVLNLACISHKTIDDIRIL